MINVAQKQRMRHVVVCVKLATHESVVFVCIKTVRSDTVTVKCKKLVKSGT